MFIAPIVSEGQNEDNITVSQPSIWHISEIDSNKYSTKKEKEMRWEGWEESSFSCHCIRIRNVLLTSKCSKDGKTCWEKKDHKKSLVFRKETREWHFPLVLRGKGPHQREMVISVYRDDQRPSSSLPQVVVLPSFLSSPYFLDVFFLLSFSFNFLPSGNRTWTCRLVFSLSSLLV